MKKRLLTDSSHDWSFGAGILTCVLLLLLLPGVHWQTLFLTGVFSMSTAVVKMIKGYE